MMIALRITRSLVPRPLTCARLQSTQAVSQKNVQSDRRAVREKRIQWFDEAVEQHRRAIGRIEKIEVRVSNIQPNEDMTLLMNRSISTPLHCAQHVGQLFVERSVFAKVNDKLWDMNRPLEEDCELSFHHFRESNPEQANRVFWRSCSFLLGKVIEDTFKEDIPVQLHSWPQINYRLGSFVYDVHLPTLPDWKVTDTELITLTKVFGQLQAEQLPIQNLKVNVQDAQKVFEDNPFKLQQLKQIAENDANASVNVYRVGSHLDFSVGPMIPHTGFVGRVNISAVHPIDSSAGRLYRFQGVALPKQLPIHHYSFKLLIDHSRKLNSSPSP